MRVIFVLGTLSAMPAWRLAELKADRIYHFSAYNFSPPGLLVACHRLSSPQLNSRIESTIVEASIERSIGFISRPGDDEALMRRALRLSELRLEARCYLNAVELIRQGRLSVEEGVESVVFVSHYLLPSDVPSFTEFSVEWKQVPNMRFVGFIPGIGRLLSLLRTIGAHKIFRKGIF